MLGYQAPPPVAQGRRTCSHCYHAYCWACWPSAKLHSLPQQQASAPTEQRLGTKWGGVASPVTSNCYRSGQPDDLTARVFHSAVLRGRHIRFALARGRGKLLDEDGVGSTSYGTASQAPPRVGANASTVRIVRPQRPTRVGLGADLAWTSNGKPGSLKNHGLLV